ncbi:Polyphosphate kinase [Alteripontixanthobacter maritimus]|uniref:Polyphosphate kinase n=1 Tax=Alteripontixanthobacter maritimus TaxID=2161824 RepID=A0A369Q1R2_9SPHN|nr:Polyphosphate kinase [Alteripontixanthobacter maritimus]
MGKLKGKDYRHLLRPLEEELVGMARWARETGQRICVLFEGRDTAGKGGAIRAVSQRLNPRQCRWWHCRSLTSGRKRNGISNAMSGICLPPGK